jgi:hypothetical protein
MLLPAILSSLIALGPAPASAAELLTAMHDRWHGKWIRTMTFVQQTRFPGRPAQIWYESIELPGKLRIDFGPADSMNAAIMRADSMYQFRHGKLVRSAPDPNTLGLLLADVYFWSPTETAHRLAGAGYDLTKFRKATLRGRPVWVVGAAAGDSTSNQFWVDQAALLLVRTVEGGPGDGAPVVGEVTRRAKGAVPVETEMRFWRNGAEMQREVYTSIRLDPPLDPSVFDPSAYRRPAWIAALAKGPT